MSSLSVSEPFTKWSDQRWPVTTTSWSTSTSCWTTGTQLRSESGSDSTPPSRLGGGGAWRSIDDALGAVALGAVGSDREQPATSSRPLTASAWSFVLEK